MCRNGVEIRFGEYFNCRIGERHESLFSVYAVLVFYTSNLRNSS